MREPSTRLGLGAHGFHSHILAHVPKEAVPDFAAWTRSTLPQLARHQGTKQTVKVVASQERDERGAVDRCWCWFRYLTKQLDERALYALGADTPLRPLRAMLKVKPYRSALPVTCGKLTGASKDIRTAAQRAAGFQSRLSWDNREQIYDGQELNDWREREHRQRMKELFPEIDFDRFK